MGGTNCSVSFSGASADCLEDLIAQQKARAERLGCSLEWKVYGHDTPPDLVRRLMAAGFEADPVEQVIALKVDREALAAFPESGSATIKRIDDPAELEAVAEISRDIGRKNVAQEQARLRSILEADPQSMSVYVAYVDGEPASCGRLQVARTGGFGELCGARTRKDYRNKGLYLALVRARLVEALERQLSYLTVDALPTSEPLLVKRGFRPVTWTQPFHYEPSGSRT